MEQASVHGGSFMVKKETAAARQVANLHKSRGLTTETGEYLLQLPGLGLFIFFAFFHFLDHFFRDIAWTSGVV